MKNKKILAILTISAIISAAATGCSFGGDEPEEQVVVNVFCYASGYAGSGCGIRAGF